MSKGTTSQDAPFGTLLGYAPGGVAIYSSDYSSLDPRDYDDDAAFRSYIDDEYMGHKWQCVEWHGRHRCGYGLGDLLLTLPARSSE